MTRLFILSSLASFVLFSHTLASIEEENEFLEGTKTVRFGNGKGEQIYNSLQIADIPKLHSRIIFSKKGLIPPDTKGVVLIYPGTSGRVDSEYGIERSLAPIANELVKRGYAVMAFQPPIYFQSHDPIQRQPYLDKYERLEDNMEWLVSTFKFAKNVMGERNLPTYYIGRSTGAALGLEILHRYSEGRTPYKIVGSFHGMLLMGLDGHTSDAITKWHEAEKKFYFEDFPEKGDKPVVLAAPKIFKDMTWQTHTPINILDSNALNSSPRVSFTVGTRDEFCLGKPCALLVPVRDFSFFHQKIPLTLFFHDGHHDPARQIHGISNGRPMSRMKLILDDFLAANKPDELGIQIVYLPDENHIKSSLSSGEFNTCTELLLKMSQLRDAK